MMVMLPFKWGHVTRAHLPVPEALPEAGERGILDEDRGFMGMDSFDIDLEADGRLKLRGYVGSPMFGQTQYWTRVSQ